MDVLGLFFYEVSERALSFLGERMGFDQRRKLLKSTCSSHLRLATTSP